MNVKEELELAARIFGIVFLFFGLSAIIIMESLRHVDLVERDPNEKEDRG